MFRNKLMVVASLLIIASMLLGACTQVQTTVVVQQETVEVARKAFTTPHPILGDLKVRQAIAYCTNKLELIQSVYPLISEDQQKLLIMNTFIPSTHWAYAGDANITIYNFDTTKGGQLLDEAGWKLAEGADYRTNEAGDELSLKFTTTSAAFRQTWAAVFEQQMAACGIRIVRLHAPSSWWFGDTTGLARRDFELGAFAWVGQADPGGQTLWACDQIPTPENGWTGQNYMGWCNAAADVAIKKANNTLIKQERIDNFRIVQQEYTKDVPAIPLFNRSEVYAYSAELAGFDPHPGETYYNYNVYDWEIPGKDTIVLGFSQEPASLFGIVEDAWVAQLALVMIGGMQTTSLDYDFQARLIKQLSTIESGLTQNNDVAVKIGDKVLDATGTETTLAADTKVFDTTGAEVTFTDGVKMKQLVTKFEYIDNIKFSDGQPLKKADFELYYKIRCDKESGATTFITCDRIQSVEFADNGYTVTWIPGVQDPLYFLPPLSWYPSHLKLADGRNLADVPAKEWATLPEIAEKPIDVGPYFLKEWVKGEKMVFEANPYWVLGAPKTKNIVIAFIAAENIEAQLLGGQIDFIGAESLAGLTETLANAEKDGKIKTLSVPSATWEHIDFNMFLK